MGGVYAPDFVTRLETYRMHQRDGLAGVRAVGATFHDRLAARSALSLDAVAIAFARDNPSHPGACEDLFPVTAGGTKRAPVPLQHHRGRGQRRGLELEEQEEHHLINLAALPEGRVALDRAEP